MSKAEHLSQAGRIKSKLCIRQPYGSCVESRIETELNRANSFSVEDIERLSEEDDHAD